MQELHINFLDYPTMLIKLFNQALESQKTFKCELQTNIDNSADLLFRQILPYKELNILQCHFTLGTDEMIQRHIKHRYQLS